MQSKSKLTFWEMWNLSFGFFGVQIAYALQSATSAGSSPLWERIRTS